MKTDPVTPNPVTSITFQGPSRELIEGIIRCSKAAKCVVPSQYTLEWARYYGIDPEELVYPAVVEVVR